MDKARSNFYVFIFTLNERRGCLLQPRCYEAMYHSIQSSNNTFCIFLSVEASRWFPIYHHVLNIFNSSLFNFDFLSLFSQSSSQFPLRIQTAYQQKLPSINTSVVNECPFLPSLPGGVKGGCAKQQHSEHISKLLIAINITMFQS